jgi:hypothetical protein
MGVVRSAPMAATPARCLAPRPIAGTCGRLLEPGQDWCSIHEDCDRSRTCGYPAGSGLEQLRPPCRAWPLKNERYCPPHHVKAEQRTERSAVRVTEHLLSAGVHPGGYPAEGLQVARVTESRESWRFEQSPREEVLQSLVRTADKNTLAYLLNLVAGKLRSR